MRLLELQSQMNRSCQNKRKRIKIICCQTTVWCNTFSSPICQRKCCKNHILQRLGSSCSICKKDLSPAAWSWLVTIWKEKFMKRHHPLLYHLKIENDDRLIKSAELLELSLRTTTLSNSFLKWLKFVCISTKNIFSTQPRNGYRFMEHGDLFHTHQLNSSFLHLTWILKFINSVQIVRTRWIWTQ